jgi:protein arginine N-methyltransferase 2
MSISGQHQQEKESEAADGLDLAEERIALNLSLHIAAADGNYEECLTLLKEEGADAWWEDENALNWSALHFAAEGGHTKVVKLLLRRGALWNAGELRS